VLLKNIGARIILGGILFGVLAINITRHVGSHGWFYTFWPIIMFVFITVGAIIGVAGMVTSAIQRRRKNRN